VPPSLSRRIVTEALGTAILLATVVGSGIMAASLAGGNQAIALLCNSIATGAILAVLITIFGPTSGAHFNPAVSMAMALRGEMSWSEVASYVVAQIAGAVAGTILAHLMFELPALQISTTTRWGAGQWMAEFVAALGLVLAILGCLQHKVSATAPIVGLYITAAYWFTASTSFANPAVTIARGLTDTFAGIAPTGVPAFIVAQLAGAAVAVRIAQWLWKEPSVR
jgi:glycerol uptake facilitator-like aquaporin